MPFEFRHLSGLWFLGLTIPLVLLYVLKVRREKRRMPSTWLWAEARRDLLARNPFQRLIWQVPLLLQLLALLLLALALSQPATRGGAIAGDRVAIVVDTSASMATRGPDGKTRLEHARAKVKALLGALAPGAQAMIVEAEQTPRVLSPMDRDVRRLQAAVEGLKVREVEGHLGPALALATEKLRQLTGQKRILLVTDGNVADRERLTSTALPLDVVKVGSPVDNAGIVRLDIRTGRDPATRREQVQAFAMVHNSGTTARDIFVTLRQRNVKTPLSSRRIQLAPGERSPVVLTFEPTRGDYGTGILVELSPHDAFAVDDVAVGRIPTGRHLTVVMAPKTASPWFRRAFLADPDVELLGANVAEIGTTAVPRDALVVTEGVCPPITPGGDVLIVNPPAGRCRTVVVGDRVDDPIVTSWDRSDPRLRYLTLDGISIAKARRLDTDERASALVRSREGALVADVSVPGRAGTLVAFDVGDSNWPLKASFVLFARNVLEEARRHRAAEGSGSSTTGRTLRVRVPAATKEITVKGPGGTSETVRAASGMAVVPEVSRAGFYYVSWKTPKAGSALMTANLTSQRESDLSEQPFELSGAPVSRGATTTTEALTSWTWLLALLALAFVMLDAWWLTRRRKASFAAAPRRPQRPGRGAAARPETTGGAA